jgi:hypothetical protein
MACLTGLAALPGRPIHQNGKSKKNGDPCESPCLIGRVRLPVSGQFSRDPFVKRAASHSCTSARMFRPASKKSSNRLGT